MNKPTLADKLGVRPAASALLRKARRLGLDSPESFESLAVVRGCWHYRAPDLPPPPTTPEAEFTNEELAIALLSPSLPYSPHTIRVGAAMLAALGNDVATIVRLTVAEQATSCVRYVASAGIGFEPENPYWRRLLDQLPEAALLPEGVMPHPTRFVSMTGFTRNGPGRVTVWIRPRPDLVLVHG